MIQLNTYRNYTHSENNR